MVRGRERKGEREREAIFGRILMQDPCREFPRSFLVDLANASNFMQRWIEIIYNLTFFYKVLVHIRTTSYVLFELYEETLNWYKSLTYYNKFNTIVNNSSPNSTIFLKFDPSVSWFFSSAFFLMLNTLMTSMMTSCHQFVTKWHYM